MNFDFSFAGSKWERSKRFHLKVSVDRFAGLGQAQLGLEEGLLVLQLRKDLSRACLLNVVFAQLALVQAGKGDRLLNHGLSLASAAALHDGVLGKADILGAENDLVLMR